MALYTCTRHGNTTNRCTIHYIRGYHWPSMVKGYTSILYNVIAANYLGTQCRVGQTLPQDGRSAWKDITER
jgi:hypothetical protein